MMEHEVALSALAAYKKFCFDLSQTLGEWAKKEGIPAIGTAGTPLSEEALRSQRERFIERGLQTAAEQNVASFLALEARLAEAEALLREIAGHYAGGWRNDHLPLLESIAKADRFLEVKEKA